MVKDKEAWCVALHGVTKSQTGLDLATEQQLSGTVLRAVNIQRANKTCFCQYSFPSAVITKYQKLVGFATKKDPMGPSWETPLPISSALAPLWNTQMSAEHTPELFYRG